MPLNVLKPIYTIIFFVTLLLKYIEQLCQMAPVEPDRLINKQSLPCNNTRC